MGRSIFPVHEQAQMEYFRNTYICFPTTKNLSNIEDPKMEHKDQRQGPSGPVSKTDGGTSTWGLARPVGSWPVGT